MTWPEARTLRKIKGRLDSDVWKDVEKRLEEDGGADWKWLVATCKKLDPHEVRIESFKTGDAEPVDEDDESIDESIDESVDEDDGTMMGYWTDGSYDEESDLSDPEDDASDDGGAVEDEPYDEVVKELYLTSGATLVVIILVRTSPDEYIIVQLHLESQTRRAVHAFTLLRDHLKETEKTDVLLSHRMIAGEAIDGNNPPDEIQSRLCKEVQEHDKMGKRVLVLTMGPNRIHRDPEKALPMVKHIEQQGKDVEVKFIKYWDYTIDEFVKAWRELKKEEAAILEVASNCDPAKSLRKDVSPEDQTTQDTINATQKTAKEKFLDSKSDEGQWLGKAVKGGNSLRETGLTETDKEEYKAILNTVRKNPNQAKAEAQKLFEKIESNKKRSAEGYEADKFGKQDRTLCFVRNSHGTPSSCYISVDEKKIGWGQSASHCAYLQAKNLLAEAMDTTALLSFEGERSVTYRDELGISINQIGFRHLKRFIITTTTRIATHEGIVVFIRHLCRLFGVEFIMTECIGLEADAIAGAEQKRMDDLKAARAKFNRATSARTPFGIKLYRDAATTQHFAVGKEWLGGGDEEKKPAAKED